MAVTQDFAETLEDGRRVLRFSGNLTMLRVRKLNQQLKALPAELLDAVAATLDRNNTWDLSVTGGALYLTIGGALFEGSVDVRPIP